MENQIVKAQSQDRPFRAGRQNKKESRGVALALGEVSGIYEMGPPPPSHASSERLDSGVTARRGPPPAPLISSSDPADITVTRSMNLRRDSALMDANVEGAEIGATRDRLRVMIWKSVNFTLSVTVRPRAPVALQYYQYHVDQRTKLNSHAPSGS
jgi:hypothetical protein